MATFYLMTRAVLGKFVYEPGRLVDDASAKDDVPGLRAQGAALWPSSDRRVAAAAALAQAKQRSAAIDERDAAQIMLGAVLMSRQGGADPVFVATRAAWYVDPADSTGTASDSNDGLTPQTPLLTEAELSRRRWAAASQLGYGGWFPVLQDTVVTYLSAPPDPVADPIYLEVARVGSATLSYAFAPTVTRTATIASLPSTRGGANPWQATASPAFTSADVDAAVLDTTASTLAWVEAVSAGVADLSEPLAYQSSGVRTLLGAVGVLPVTVAVGHAVEVLKSCRVKLARCSVKQVPSGGAFEHWAVTFYGFQFEAVADGFGFPDAMTVRGETAGIGFAMSGVCFTQCAFEGLVQHVGAFDGMVNCYAPAVGHAATNSNVALIGGVHGGQLSQGSWWVLDSYVTLTNPSGAGLSDQQRPGKSIVFLGTASLYKMHDAFLLDSGSQLRVLGTTGLPEEVVGSINGLVFEVSNGSLVLKKTSRTWTQVFGGIGLGAGAFASFEGHGHSNAVVLDPTTPAIGTTPIAVTPASLDASVGSGGFGGNAVFPGTGTGFRVFLV